MRMKMQYVGKTALKSRRMKINPFGGQTKTKKELLHYINTLGRHNYSSFQKSQRSIGGFRGRPYPRGTQNTRGQQRNNNVNISNQCYKCGNQCGENHLQSCPANDKICSKCAKRGHFAKVCRSTNVNYLGNRQEEQQEEIESLETESEPVAFAEFTSNNGCDEYQIDKFSDIAIAESFEIKKTRIPCRK